MKILRSFALGAAVLAAVPVVHASVYVDDNFGGSNYTTGGLLGQDSPPWIEVSSTVNPIQVTGGQVVLDNTGQDLQQAFNVGNVSTSGLTSLYTIANITVTATGTGDYFLHLGLAGNTSLFYQRLEVDTGTAPNTFDLGILATSGNTTPPVYGSDLPLNVPVEVVVAWDFNSGSLADQFSIYIDPTSIRADDTPYATVTWGNQTATAEPTSIGAVDFRQGSAGAAGNLTVSSVEVTDTFPVSVPEPSAAAIGIGAAVLALAAWRRSLRA